MFAFLPVSLQIYLYSLMFLLGIFLGSALNCLAFRMARGMQWSKGRSLCPRCGHILSALDLIPLFSFLFLKGKCRYCGQPISCRYVLSELTLGICFVTLLHRFGLTLSLLSTSVLCCCLLCLSLVDLDIQIIPHRFLILPALARLAQLILEGDLLSGILPALVFGGGLLVFSRIMDALLQKDSLGGGDIKLMALLGLYFSIPECLFLLIAACLLGLAAGCIRKTPPGTPFPFGPYLSLAAWLTLLTGSEVVSWYLDLFSLSGR